MVHGCFWHGHSCSRATVPATNADFWRDKIEGNARRDRRQQRELMSLGWRVAVVWECQTRKGNLARLTKTLTKFLGRRQ